ncbi:hypothetical protein SAV14893_050850 [Streptomyces avermitilis]|uniref:Uncharacterized protein n=1 Tax=Streptomyces avermitilis TaxID=33903 RepID=A0A4D4LWE6_STRAX|nr:hypothetical protein SAVMC3_63180 [Streptomyces avermitilis]GDY65692.1 hypothetical protein SAV14893_050850 [Streptomyces avermitilis]GDY74089.1 hypothetical protein SAV31267_035740 [Streptomyces avermitilis]GDY83157.1 hypothetical protein SAVCW2_23560 [Streptomyces avermitilis]
MPKLEPTLAPLTPSGSTAVPTTPLPLLVRAAITGGRPAVLAAALALSAPGEYRLAVLAGWDWRFALIMPGVLSLYASVAAAIAGSLPKGSTERKQANAGALIALALAMTAQVASHLIEAGYLDKSPAVVVAVSAVPPLVAAHTLHLTAAATRLTPKAVRVEEPVSVPAPAVQESLETVAPEPSRQNALTAPPVPSVPLVTPVMEADEHEASEEPQEADEAPEDEPEVTEEPEPVTEPEKPRQELTQRDRIDQVIRALYDELGNRRPATRHMVAALTDAGLPNSEGTARESRKRVELAEPHLKDLPDAIAA